jgi:predicted nucleotidyltransferase
MKNKTETTIDELVEQCKILERKQDEMDESINKLLRFEEEYAWETRHKIKQLKHEEIDCLGDNNLLNLIDEKRTILNKIERQHDNTLSCLRRELLTSQEESSKAITSLRNQINEKSN